LTPDALAAKASALSIEQANKLSAEAIKKESKAEQKAKAEEEKRKEMKILIKRVERTKRKFVTVIQGLDGFGEFNPTSQTPSG
jgi:translation initiation factor 1 (eIF-1/SUI1)